MLEKDIEQRFVRYAKLKGCTAYKFSSPNRRGVPDRMVVGPNGLLFFIEFKAPGRQPSALQEREMQRLRDYGFPVYLIDKKGAAEQLLDLLIECSPDKI